MDEFFGVIFLLIIVEWLLFFLSLFIYSFINLLIYLIVEKFASFLS